MVRFTFAGVIALTVACSTAAAQKSRLAIDGSLATTGFGANLQYKIDQRFVFRGGFNYLDFDVADENYDGVDYDVTVDMSTVSGGIEFHPFKNGFLIGAGVFFGRDKNVFLVSSLEEEEEVEIGELTVTREEAGILSAQTDFEDLSPYLGLGWDSTLFNDARFNWSIRAGAMIAGSPEIEITSAQGLLSEDATFLDALETEENNLEDELESFEIWPVLNLGLSYRF